MDHSVVRPGCRDPLGLLLRVNLLSSWRRIKGIREQSSLLTAVIATFLVGYLALAFWLFHAGLRFVMRFPGLGELLVERLLFLLFAFLFFLLLLSNLVIAYSNFFRNRETSFLMTQPVPMRVIFQLKFIESTLLASWAFLFLIAPLVAAYGKTQGVPWHFYVSTVLVVALFVILPGILGSCLAVVVARYLDRRTFQVVAVAGVVSLLVAASLYYYAQEIPEESQETRILVVLETMLSRTRFAQYPWLPSYWISSTVLLWAQGALLGALFFILVLLSYVLFFGVLAFFGMGQFFYDAASATQSRASVFGRWRKRGGATVRGSEEGLRLYPGPAERFARCFWWMRADTRALIVKDARVMWRDTTQWAQSLMLFGLLAVYIFNLRHFTQQLSNPFWIHLVSFLNLGACSLNLATLTTRFVYPQFSLEGKRLWIIGLAPLGLARMVMIKFWMATCLALVITIILISISCYMLNLPWVRSLFFTTCVTIMTLTLSGLAVGLGTLYPNFKEDNPSKIVSGFGGTLCLVLSFLYILAAVILLAVAVPWSPDQHPVTARSVALVGSFLGLSIALGWIPMAMGVRRARSVEI